MSDTPASATPSEPAASAKIDFERAEFAEPTGQQVACGLCGRAITTEYWHSLGKILCDTCRHGVRQAADDARRGATFGKAALLGGGVALGCGIGYAIFVGVTHIQFALVTIGIGWAVGRAIQHVTRGFGGRRHQVLAVALTYFASTLSYVPAIFKGFSVAANHDDHGSSSTAASTAEPGSDSPSPTPADTSSPATDETPTRATPTRGAEPPAPRSGGIALSLIVATAFTVALALAAPFFELSSGFSGVLGLLIIFFGLRTAWRVSKGIEASVTGPHKVAASAAS